VIFFFEGQSAEIDKAILGDVVSLALQCFAPPRAFVCHYIVIDPKRMHICRLYDEVTAPVFVLKRADLYDCETVFSGQGVIEMSDLPIFMVSKLLISAPMKELLSAVRTRYDKPLGLCHIREDRLRALMKISSHRRI
jgi:hypothetical protein